MARDIIDDDDDFPAAVAGGGFTGCNALDQAGLNRIPGLAAIVPPLSDPDFAATLLGAATPAPLTGADLATQAFTGLCPLQGEHLGRRQHPARGWRLRRP